MAADLSELCWREQERVFTQDTSPPPLPLTHPRLDHPHTHTHLLGGRRQDGVVVVVLLLLTEDLELQEELLLMEDFGIRRVQMGRRFYISLLVRGDVLMVL